MGTSAVSGSAATASSVLLASSSPLLHASARQSAPTRANVVARLKGPNDPGLPAYVNLPRQVSFGKAAYLGAAYNPFSPDASPNATYANHASTFARSAS